MRIERRHAKAFNHLFSFRVLLALVIVLIEIVFIDNLATAGIEFILSSAVVTMALLIQLRFGVQENAPAPANMVVFIFNWLFLDLAPKVQLINMPQRLINTSTVTTDGVAWTNLVCALFMIAFTLFYAFLSKRAETPPPTDAAPIAARQEFAPGAVGLALFFCILVVGLAAPSPYASVEKSEAATPASLVAQPIPAISSHGDPLDSAERTVLRPVKYCFSAAACVLCCSFFCPGTHY